ncbi:GumC family protein [Azospirillum palustre]
MTSADHYAPRHHVPRHHDDPARNALGLVGELDFKQTLITLWRRRYYILLLTAIAAGGAWLLVSRIQPVYTATAEVMIDSRRTRIVDIKEILSQLSPQLVTVSSEVEVLQSRTLATRVADALNLYDDPEFNPALRPEQPSLFDFSSLRSVATQLRDMLSLESPTPIGPTPAEAEASKRAEVIDRLRSGLGVAAVPQSMVIRISYRSPNPAAASRIANAFAEHYITEQLEAKFQAVRYATNWLNERLEGLRRDLAASEQAISAYRATHNLLESHGASTTQQKLTEQNSRLVETQSKRAEVAARIARLEAVGRAGRGMAASDELLDSSFLSRLKEQEATLSGQASDLASRYGERHPQIAKIRAELGEIRGKISTEIARLTQGLRSELAVLQDREQSMSREIREMESRSFSQNNAEIGLRELEREAQANRILYETFLNRFKETDQQETIQQPDARIISFSERPRSPTSPKKFMLILAATLGGMMSALALVLLVEKFDNTIRTKDQLEQLTGLPALGLVPQISGPAGNVAAYLVERPASSYAEAFRIACFAIRHPPDRPEPKTLVITSTVPDEGKSLTSLSIGRTASMLGLRVLLVDADMRRASISAKVGKASDLSLAEVLTEGVDFRSAVIRDPLTGLDILTATAAGRKPVDMLAMADKVHQTMQAMRDAYDLVIFDCPPVLSVADVQVLARHADATLFCLRWNATPRESVLAAVRMLKDAKANVAGVLLTRVNVRKHASYGYRDMGYYYGKHRNYYTN